MAPSRAVTSDLVAIPLPPAVGLHVMTNNDAVSAVLDSVYAAWADNDADKFVAPYADTATAILPGAYLPNREAVRTTMAALFAAQLKGSRGVHDVKSIRFPNADTAIVISMGGTVLAGATDADSTTDTWVLCRHAGTWLVEAYHSCPAEA